MNADSLLEKLGFEIAKQDSSIIIYHNFNGSEAIIFDLEKKKVKTYFVKLDEALRRAIDLKLNEITRKYIHQ